MKILLRIFASLVAVAALVITFLYLREPAMAAPRNIKVPQTPERIARGKYLFENMADCAGCHSDRDPSRFGLPVIPGSLGAGFVFPKELGLPGDVVSPNLTSDPDADGVPNIFEYAFNLSPQVNDISSLPRFQLQSHNVNGTNGTYLTVQFPRQLGATNLTYILQGSSNLVTWTALCTAASTNPPAGPGFISESGTAYKRTILARDLVPVERATSSRFVRFELLWN